MNLWRIACDERQLIRFFRSIEHRNLTFFVNYHRNYWQSSFSCRAWRTKIAFPQMYGTFIITVLAYLASNIISVWFINLLIESFKIYFFNFLTLYFQYNNVLLTLPVKRLSLLYVFHTNCNSAVLWNWATRINWIYTKIKILNSFLRALFFSMFWDLIIVAYTNSDKHFFIYK